jgi:hypothetical protein
LLERCLPTVTVDAQNALKILADLQADCAQENISARPLFAEVANHNLASKRVLEKNGFALHDEGGKISMFKLDK